MMTSMTKTQQKGRLMQAKDIHVGSKYVLRTNGHEATVVVLQYRPEQVGARYVVKNVDTNRKLRVKSARRFVRAVDPPVVRVRVRAPRQQAGKPASGKSRQKGRQFVRWTPAWVDRELEHAAILIKQYEGSKGYATFHLSMVRWEQTLLEAKRTGQRPEGYV